MQMCEEEKEMTTMRRENIEGEEEETRVECVPLNSETLWT
jgi:hypothetical protein